MLISQNLGLDRNEAAENVREIFWIEKVLGSGLRGLDSSLVNFDVNWHQMFCQKNAQNHAVER